MKNKIKIAILTIFTFIFFTNKIAAQATLEKEYYIEIKNVNNKILAENVELLVKSKPTVTFFSGYKIPVAFHLLKSSKNIGKAEFEGWLKPLGLELLIFEERTLDAKFVMLKKRGKSNSEKKI